jgi:hypothetical protein
MRKVTISQPRVDCLEVRSDRDWRRALGAAGALLVTSGLILIPERGSLASIAALVLGAATMVVIGLSLRASLTSRHHLLTRSSGRLVLDGEPLEMARVELKLVVTPIFRRPAGCVLTLWVVTAAGPLELPLGRFATMLEASKTSGLVEDFVQRAGVKQRRLA